MRNIWKYMWKFVKNDGKLYTKEQQTLQEAFWFFVMSIISVLLLLTPLGRNILRWLSYIFVGGSGGICACMLIGAVCYCFKMAKHYARLDDVGVPHEEDEKARIKLCEQEGDDGFPPMAFGNDEVEPHVYFMDAGALARYSNALYIYYMMEKFSPQYMKLEEEAVIYTTAKELEKLREAETLENIDGAPFPNYMAYIRNYLMLVPDVPLEAIWCKRDGGMEDTPTTDDERNVALAIELQKREGLQVIMISESEEVHDLAEFNGIAVKKPFDVVY